MGTQGIFVLFQGPPAGCGEINFFKLIILLPSQRSTVRETREILSSERPRSAGGAQDPNAGKGKKVKFSHARYRALGPELIPVYRQSAHR